METEGEGRSKTNYGKYSGRLTDSIFGEYSDMIVVCEKNEIVLFIES